MCRRGEHVCFPEAETAVVESQRCLFENMFVEVPAQDTRRKRRRGFIKSIQQLRVEVTSMRAQAVRYFGNIGANSPEE